MEIAGFKPSSQTSQSQRWIELGDIKHQLPILYDTNFFSQNSEFNFPLQFSKKNEI